MSLPVLDFDDYANLEDALSEDDDDSSKSSAGSSEELRSSASLPIYRSSPSSLVFPRKHVIRPSFSIAACLWDRELGWSSHFRQGTRRPLQCNAVCKHVRLLDIVQSAPEMMEANHVFLGFTQDGCYIISYTVETCGHTLFDLSPQIRCTLHIWRFSPFARSTRLIHSTPLFDGVSNIPHNFKCTVSQWLDDHSHLVVLGYWEASEERHVTETTENQAAITIITLPPHPHPHPHPLSHFLPHTHPLPHSLSHPHPHPLPSSALNSAPRTPSIHTAAVPYLGQTAPELSLLVHDLVVLQCGGLLFLYRLVNGDVREVLKTSSVCLSDEIGRKRKFSDDEVIKNSLTPHCNEMIQFRLNSDEAVIWEAFFENDENSKNSKSFENSKKNPQNSKTNLRNSKTNLRNSRLIDATGVERVGHPLEDVLRHVGAPKFFGDVKSDFCVEMATVRTDILILTAWDNLKNHVDLAILTKQDHICRLDSVRVLTQEVILKACLFLEGIQKGSGTGTEKASGNGIGIPSVKGGGNGIGIGRSQLVSIFMPVFLHVNYITGDCSVHYYGSAVQTVGVGQFPGVQGQLRVMEQLVKRAEGRRKKKEVVRTVHSLNNFNVSEEEESLVALLSPDGTVKITL